MKKKKGEKLLTCHVAGHVVPTRGCLWSSGHRTRRGDASRHRSAQSCRWCCWWEMQGLLGNEVQMIGQSQNTLILQPLKTIEISIDILYFSSGLQSVFHTLLWEKLMFEIYVGSMINNIPVRNLLSPSVSNQYQSSDSVNKKLEEWNEKINSELHGGFGYSGRQTVLMENSSNTLLVSQCIFLMGPFVWLGRRHRRFSKQITTWCKTNVNRRRQKMAETHL